MDILVTQFCEKTKNEEAKIFHNIDKDSIAIDGLVLYFAHPGSWESGRNSHRYQINLRKILYVTTDPEEIQNYIDEHKDCIMKGLYTSSISKRFKELENISRKLYPAR